MSVYCLHPYFQLVHECFIMNIIILILISGCGVAHMAAPHEGVSFPSLVRNSDITSKTLLKCKQSYLIRLNG